MRQRVPLAILLATIAAGTLAAPAGPRASGDLVVHEWGTFTSIADEQGQAAEWIPASQRADLPTFVHRRSFGPKGLLRGTVRMETPVVYFYAARDLQVTARVRFRNGVITEWYPRAMVTPAAAGNVMVASLGFEASIVWRDVNVLAHGRGDFPVEASPSHYYAARETEAAAVEFAGQREKFLFYRGVGNFLPPIVAVVAGDQSVAVSSSDGRPLGPLIFFERRGDAVAYEVRHAGSRVTFARHPAVADSESLFVELESILVGQGLFPSEARAMVTTWKESWFEEGARLLYLVPRDFIDTVLPLDVDPVPADVARVFVGRVELVTGVTLDAVRDALARNDRTTLQKYDRFLPHILSRLQ